MNLRKYDYIEIGTSDFDTLVQLMPDSALGISVEPIKEYLDLLPEKENNQKVNAAISDTDKKSTVYLVKPEDIRKYGLDEWVKGCNSIDSPHPSVLTYLRAKDLLDIYHKEEIECLSIKTLIERYSIGEVDLLKIDTEGHDFVIIKSLLKTELRPNKIHFEANSLYQENEILEIIRVLEEHGYFIVQRTFNDITVRLKDNRYSQVPENLPILVFSTGRRLDHFTKTLRSLFDKNPGFGKMFKSVWVMDDRSSAEDRFHMDKMLSSYFGDICHIVSFNSGNNFYFVEKFNLIGKIADPNDIIFLMEDDWICHDNLRLFYHVHNLQNSDWTQIAFADALEIQDKEIQNEFTIDLDYWHNPFPKAFKHVFGWDGDICFWASGAIKNYTNNPSLIKASFLKANTFKRIKNFEWEYADTSNGDQVFTTENHFRHIYENSLIDKL
jgi:FkbM family methyltransferase